MAGIDSALRDLADAYDDFLNAGHNNAASVLARFVASFDEEPLAGFLASSLPAVDFPEWLAHAQATKGAMVGSGEMAFPADRP
jgi:hypothetical protein